MIMTKGITSLHQLSQKMHMWIAAIWSLLIIFLHVLIFLFFVFVHAVSIVGIIAQELQGCFKDVMNIGTGLMGRVLHECFQGLQAVLPEFIIALHSIMTELDYQGNCGWQVLAKAISN